MDNIKVLTVGGSRNIGYFSSIRLLELGATVTFLLRKPSVFDDDVTIQNYVRSGKARLVQGDALAREDVARAWTAAQGTDDTPVDFLVFTVGGSPRFELSKGFVISPPDLVTRAMRTCLETLPHTRPRPGVVALSAMGATRAGHARLPRLLKPVYSYLLAALHADKRGMEAVLAHAAGWEWKAEEDAPGSAVLPGDWTSGVGLPEPGELKGGVVVVRPALLTDGPCRADKWDPSSPKGPYVAEEGDIAGGWTVSRKDVAHFVVENVMRRWDEWKGKRVSIAY